MANIIVKKYEHFNRAMGKYIGSRREYEREMIRGDYLPFEKATQLAESARGKARKPYLPSERLLRFLNEVKGFADKKGNIKVSNRFVQGLKEHGVNVDCQWDKLPKNYQKGGFE